jgi:hypothetical protein
VTQRERFWLNWLRWIGGDTLPANLSDDLAWIIEATTIANNAEAVAIIRHRVLA